jgi:hypothetical protein
VLQARPSIECAAAHADEAFLFAVNVAELPSVPPRILNDIPRPPNTASRDG